MKRQQLKRYIATVLEEYDLVQARKQLASISQRSLVNPLVSCLCHGNELVRWHCVSILGEVVHHIAADDMEQGRIIMRRFLWMLNDESGGIGWGVPEAMSESMYHNKKLAEEYMHMLVSYSKDDGDELFQDGNFIELPLLQHGVLWGLCRLAEKYKKRLRDNKVGENIGFYLSSEDGQVRGLACLFCGLMEMTEFGRQLGSLTTDTGVVRVYSDGEWSNHTVGHLASRSLTHMEVSSS